MSRGLLSDPITLEEALGCFLVIISLDLSFSLGSRLLRRKSCKNAAYCCLKREKAASFMSTIEATLAVLSVMTELVRVGDATPVARPWGASAKRNAVTLWLKVPSRMPRAYYSPHRVCKVLCATCRVGVDLRSQSMAVIEAVTPELSMGMRTRCAAEMAAAVHPHGEDRRLDWDWKHRGLVIRHRSVDMAEESIVASHLG